MNITPKQHAIALYELSKKIPVGRIDELTKEYIAYIAKRGKAKLLSAIARELEWYCASLEGVIFVDVASAHPLDSHTLSQIKSAVKKASKKEPVLFVRQDETLIGGVRIKAEHTVVDASLRAYIRQFKEHILVS